MDTDLKKHINAIKKIKEYDSNLDRQNLWWTVVAMVGKINNQGLEPQLLDSISATQAQFDKLKSELITNLVNRYLEKVEVDVRLKGQAFIDILNRNLFERTADVGFLATDQSLVDYLKQGSFTPCQRSAIEERLREYVAKYSVYMDIALFTPQGELVASLSQPDSSSNTHSSVIFDALNSNDYIEYDQPVDLVAYQETPLYYVQRVQYQNQTVGVLCMSFKFVDELARISTSLNGSDQGFELALTSQQKILYKTDSQLNSALQLNKESLYQFGEEKVHGQQAFCYCCRTTGYQGYEGLDWVSTSYIPTHNAFSMAEDGMHMGDLTQDSALFPFDLYMLNLEINTALTIVVLNGKISSLKNKVKSFLPVLDYFQDIGLEVKDVFADSINHIHAVAHATMQEKANFSAKIAQEVMDRNLYERANDVRWWALNPLISETLAQSEIKDYRSINQTLKIINDLYTVYTLLFVFDKQGTIVGVSKPDAEHLIGKNIKDSYLLKRVSSVQSTQQYVVSDFAASEFYDNKPTYIYYGAVRNPQDNQVTGGVAAVFDSEPEFEAILNDFLPKNSSGKVTEGAFAMVVDSRSNIISASANEFGLEAGKKIEQMAVEVQQIVKTEDNEVTLQGQGYIVASSESLGYREYKIDDGYVNDMKCYVCVKS